MKLRHLAKPLATLVKTPMRIKIKWRLARLMVGAFWKYRRIPIVGPTLICMEWLEGLAQAYYLEARLNNEK